jgi:hypothetical protein
MVTTVSQINNLTFTTSFFESTSKRDTSEKFDEMLLSRSMKKKTFTDPLLYHSWDDRLDKIKSMPISWDGKEVCFVDVSVIYNVKDFLDQIDNIFMDYLDEENILPTPYGTITLDFEKNNDVISVEIGESKIAFFTDFENKANSKLDGTYFNHKIPVELKNALIHFMG